MQSAGSARLPLHYGFHAMRRSGHEIATAPPGGWPRMLGRLLPALLLAAGLALFLLVGPADRLDVFAIAQHRSDLLAWVAARPLLSPLLFTLLYMAAVAFSLPVGLLLTVTAGFLFGPLLGTLAAVVGATGGAVILFLAARSALGARLRDRVAAALRRMDAQFRDNAFNYLLSLRLVPIFPFWLVNIVPAFTDMKLRTYLLATALGILPGTLVYALVGNGLGAVIDAGGTPDLGIVFRPAILAPLLGLGTLALLPVLLRRRRGSMSG